MANITTQTIRVDLSTDKVIPSAFTHQNDTARTLVFDMYNGGMPYTMTGNTVKFAYKSPIVNGQYSVIAGASMASGTVSGNKVTVTLPSAYTAISGVGMLTMIITPTSGTVRPVNIRLVVQKSADGDDTVAGASDFPITLEETVDAWLDDNVPGSVSDVLSNLNSATANLLEKFYYSDSVDLTFQAGDRGSSSGASVAIVDSSYMNTSTLFSISENELYTIVNLAPDKYRFTIRGYTNTEEANGTMVSGPMRYIYNDQSNSTVYTSAVYSNSAEPVYKNTIGFFKQSNTSALYAAVMVRRISGNRGELDIAEINNSIRVIKSVPVINRDFQNKIGDFATIFSYGTLNIDTTNNTVSCTRSYTLKCGDFRRNNVPFDLTGFTDGYQTFYWDMVDNVIKVVGYANLKNIDHYPYCVIVGSYWQTSNVFPLGYFSFNTNMPIHVNGKIQLSEDSQFWPNKSMVLYGDSICRGQTTSSGTTDYTLQKLVGLKIGIDCTNTAVGGACIAARSGYASDICKLIDSSIADYTYMVLFAGTNDYGQNIPLGSINDIPSNADGNTFYSALKYIIEYAITNNPDIEIAVITPTFRNYQQNGGTGNTYTTVQNSQGKTLGDYTDAMIEVCNYYNVPVYDMRKNSIINHLNYASMLEEQSAGNGLYLHPKNATYEIINNKIINWLKTVF